MQLMLPLEQLPQGAGSMPAVQRLRVLFRCRTQAVLFPPLLNGMYGGHVVPNLSTDARTLSIEAMQQGGADSQRPVSAAQAGEEFEQHAISQPIAVRPLGGLLSSSPCHVRSR
jgi:hypothetical protein